MSQENVENVRASVKAWAAGDVRQFQERFDPDVVMRTVQEWPEAGPHFGREAVSRFFEQLRDTWDTGEMEEVSLIDAGDRVISRFRWHGVGRGPDATIDVTAVETFRKGKVVMVEYFWNYADALEALGLSEQAIPVSHANVEIVRSALQAIGPNTDRDDWIHEFFDAEIEWHDTPTYPSAGVYIGHEAFSRHAAEFEEAWEDWGIEIEDIKAAGDRVVACIRYRGVGRLSGAPISGGQAPATGAVFELRGGRIVRVVQFVTPAEALEAAGLSE